MLYILHKKYLSIFLLICLPFIGGCWDRKELNQIAIVMGAGVDHSKNGDVEITAQIAKPGEIRTQGGSKGNRPDADLVLTSDGKTVFDAIRNFIAISSRKLFWSHNQVLIFGEEQARNGLAPVIDFFERDHEPRVEVPILIAKGRAEDILLTPGEIEKLSAIEIKQALNAAAFLSKASRIDYHEFVEKLHYVYSAPVAPRIQLQQTAEGKKFKISGMAVFRKDKLVGWLDEKETRGLLWVLGKVKSTIVVVQVPDASTGKVSLEVFKTDSKVKVSSKGNLLLTVEIEVDSKIGEETGPLDPTKPHVLKMINEEQEKIIANEINSALTKAKELKSDVFGFSQAIHSQEPKEWAKLKTNWEQEFPKLEVNVMVKAKTRRTGDKIKPTITKTE